MYYLQSRYYDPETGRFISADIGISAPGEIILGNNMFTYCFNNPVNASDNTGNWPQWVETAAMVVSAAVLVAAVTVTVIAVSAATAGTGSVAAVYGASVLLGAALAGINGAVANYSKGDSYANGYVGGVIGGGTQAAASALPLGNIWGGAIGAGRSTAITMTLNNLDPDSSNSSIKEIAQKSISTGFKGAVTGTLTQFMGHAVDAGVASQANGLMPELTLGFGEGIKAFFGWVDDALIYLWE